MANHTIKQVEDAIITALKAGMTYLKACETYGGQLEDALSRHPGPLPAVFVEYGSRQFTEEDAEDQLFETPWTFNIYVATSNSFSEVQARRGTAGCYTMLDDVKTVLAGKTAGLLDFLPFLPREENVVLNEGGVVAYVIRVVGTSYYHVT
jgi:phage gp37-like protein